MMTPKFQMGQKVYYKLPEGEEGIILDICYYYKSKSFNYLIGLDYVTRTWVNESEITDVKEY